MAHRHSCVLEQFMSEEEAIQECNSQEAWPVGTALQAVPTGVPENIWESNGQKHLKYDENYKPTDPKSPTNPMHKEYDKNHTKAHHKHIA